MTHQVQRPIEGSPAEINGRSGLSLDRIEFTLDPDQIERHILEGRRLRAEATRGFFQALFGRLFLSSGKTDRVGAPPQTSGNQPLQA